MPRCDSRECIRLCVGPGSSDAVWAYRIYHDTTLLAEDEQASEWNALGFGLRKLLEILRQGGKPKGTRMLEILGTPNLVSCMTGSGKDTTYVIRCLQLLAEIAQEAGYGWRAYVYL